MRQFYFEFEFHSGDGHAGVHLRQLLNVHGQISYGHFGLAASDRFQERVVYENVLFLRLETQQYRVVM